MRKVIRWLVYAGAFLIPLWFLPFTADVLEFNKQILLFALAGVGLVLFLIDMIRSGKLRMVPSVFYWPLGGLIIAGVIATAMSVHRASSVFGVGSERAFSLISWVSVAVLFFLALNVIEDRGKALRNIIVSSLGIAFLFGALQVIGLHLFPGSTFGRPSFNTIGSLNAMGLLAAAAIPLFLARPDLEVPWQRMAIQILRFTGLLTSLFLLVVLNSPNSHLIWIVAFIGLLAYIAFTSSTEAAAGKMKFFALPMAVIVIGIFLWIIQFNWTAITSKFPVEVAPKHSDSYQIAKAALKAKPLGYGLENFVIGYDRHRPASIVNNVLFQARFTDATSEVETMAVEGGIPMLLAFIAFIVFFVRALIRRVKENFSGDATQGKVWATCVALVALFFLYPLNLSIVLTLLMLLAIAVLASQSETSEARVYDLEGKSTYSLIGSVSFIVGLVAVLVGGYFITNQVIANVQLAKAETASDPDKKVAAYVASINSYEQDSRPYRALSQTLLTLIADDLKPGQKGTTQAEFATRLQNRITSAINVAVRATEVDPADSENWLNRGYVYQNLINLVNGSDEAAINMYRASIERSPANALAYVRLGNVYLTKGNLDGAEEQYKKAIELYNNYGQALYNLAATYDRKGELAQAIKQFEKLQASNPRDPSILFQSGLLYYRNGQRDAAKAAWERAVTVFPDYSNARWYLSLVYEENNDLKGALAQVEAIEKVNPDNQVVKDRLEKLRAGIRTFVPPNDVLDQAPLNSQQ
ncbi:MAG: tetratricopeptide repeat protein [Patescibacteria group bacterium]